MGYSSELMIEQHNHLMDTDEDYRESYIAAERDYLESCEAARERELEMEKFTDWFSDWRIAADGTEVFACDLCGKPNDSPNGHKECADSEQAWADAENDDLPY